MSHFATSRLYIIDYLLYWISQFVIYSLMSHFAISSLEVLSQGSNIWLLNIPLNAIRAVTDRQQGVKTDVSDRLLSVQNHIDFFEQSLNFGKRISFSQSLKGKVTAVSALPHNSYDL
jgi:hypothetical protein